MCGQFGRQAFFVKFLHALEILDVTGVTPFVPESRLAVDQGAVGYVALTEYSWIGLCQML